MENLTYSIKPNVNPYILRFVYNFKKFFLQKFHNKIVGKTIGGDPVYFHLLFSFIEIY